VIAASAKAVCVPPQPKGFRVVRSSIQIGLLRSVVCAGQAADTPVLQRILNDQVDGSIALHSSDGGEVYIYF